MADRGASKRVLVVDDDDVSRRTLAQWLQLNGYAPLEATGGRAALFMLRAAPKLIDGVLLDLQMPDMDGEAFRWEQLADPRIAAIPVIVVSGRSGCTGGATRMGVACVEKPFDPALLRATLQRVLA